jgi:hypothetical protein
MPLCGQQSRPLRQAMLEHKIEIENNIKDMLTTYIDGIFKRTATRI